MKKETVKVVQGVLILIGFVAFFGGLIFTTHLSEQSELEYYKTCIDAGGSYHEEGIGRSPVCEMP